MNANAKASKMVVANAQQGKDFNPSSFGAGEHGNEDRK